VVLGVEERQDVICALGRLPHRQREALMLRFTATFPTSRSRR
jgi:hypothetical protein